MTYFQDKIIWLTGASSGIGEALAYLLNKHGATLILSSRNKTALERVKNNCTDVHKVFVQVLDLEKTDTLYQIASDILKQFGKIDILINNGGISQRSFAAETVIEVDKRLMQINYLGTVALTKSILPSMIARKSGHIATVTSLTGIFGTPYRSSYAASKHALHGFFDSLRAELINDNITVSLICPGYVHTNISYNAFIGDGSKQNSLDDRQAEGMTPDDFAIKMLHAIKKQKKEVYIGKKEVLMVYIKRYLPWLYYKMIAKVKVK